MPAEDAQTSRAIRHVLVTGFGPFGEVTFNPSGAIAQSLAAAPPPGWRVTAAVLPVTYAGAPRAVDQALAAMEAPPDMLLGLGVHPGHAFRIERGARGVFVSARPDLAHAFHQPELASPPLFTELDLSGAAQGLVRAGAGAVVLSSDAGQYVCERTYHHLLSCARAARCHALFIHVPPASSMAHELQAAVLRTFLGLNVLAG